MMDSKPKIFEQIFKKYYQRMCLYARKFVDEDAIAEDIVQDVFSNLWEKQIIIEIEEVLRAYLFKSVFNRCVNHLNHLKLISKHKNQLSEELKKIELDYYRSGNSHSLFELEIKLDEAIAALPAQCRNVFELSRVRGLKNREIAEELSISLKVVEKHISKALMYLREKLKDYITILLPIIFLIKKIKN